MLCSPPTLVVESILIKSASAMPPPSARRSAGLSPDPSPTSSTKQSPLISPNGSYQMQPESTQQRRIMFTTDAKLAIRRKPAAKMAADSSAQPADASADEPTVMLEGYAMVWGSLSDDRGGY